MSDPFEQQRTADEAMRQSQEQLRRSEENARLAQQVSDGARSTQAADRARALAAGSSVGGRLIGLLLFLVALAVIAYIVFLR